jgi:hypothetical protein
MLIQTIESKIYEIRGQKVMLDFDLAELYEVETKVLNQAVKRNINRFPGDFMFQLTMGEWNSLRSQFVTSKGKGGTRYFPYAFTEQGLAMLSGILNSEKAVEVNILIMRAFVYLRQFALTHKDLRDKIQELEDKYNKKFKDVYEALNYLLNKDKQLSDYQKRKKIGY